MMKLNILSILMIFVVCAAFAQDNKEYIMTMVKQKNALGTAVTEKDFQELADNFERISKTETDQWHPLYYAALCYINVSFTGKESDKRDTDLDKAQSFIDKALEIYPEESELWVLQGLVYQARIQIDPMKRGKDFSVKANQALNQAKEFNPENPRVYYLLGMNVLHRPKAFGGGPEAACALFAQAGGKFTSYLPENVLLPTWGAAENDKLYSEHCLNKK